MESTTPLKKTCDCEFCCQCELEEEKLDLEYCHDQIPQLVLFDTPVVEETKKIWYNAVIQLVDGTLACEAFDTENEAVKHIDFVSKKCEEKSIGIIRTSICPSDDPAWIEKVQNSFKGKLAIAKQKELEVTLKGKSYGSRLRKIDYSDPSKITDEYMTGPPVTKGAREVQVPKRKIPTTTITLGPESWRRKK